MFPAGSGANDGDRSVAVDPLVAGAAHPRAVAFVSDLLSGGVTVHVIGPTPLLEAAFAAPELSGRLILHDATGAVGDDEDPGVVRGRPSVPVRVAVDLLAEGVVDAVFSAARPELVLTTASFRLGRLRAQDLVDGVMSPEARRVWAAAQPGVAVDIPLADSSANLRLVDAGVAARATATDVLGRMLDAAPAGARLGLLDPTGRRGSLVRDVLALAQQIEVPVQVVGVDAALAGACDVVGCAPDSGAVMVEVLRVVGRRTTGLARITGVPGDVTCLLADDLPAATSAAAVGGVGP